MRNLAFARLFGFGRTAIVVGAISAGREPGENLSAIDGRGISPGRPCGSQKTSIVIARMPSALAKYLCGCNRDKSAPRNSLELAIQIQSVFVAE